VKLQLIADDHLNAVCRRGQGSACCAFLASHNLSDFYCAKQDPDLLRVIQSRLVEGSMGAQGNNCSGPPDYALSSPMRIWKTGERLRIVYRDRTVEGHVILSSPNGRSLMLGFDALLGGYAGMMPVSEEQGVFRDLMTKSTVTLLDPEDGS
jgi:hypothetical protein